MQIQESYWFINQKTQEDVRENATTPSHSTLPGSSRSLSTFSSLSGCTHTILWSIGISCRLKALNRKTYIQIKWLKLESYLGMYPLSWYFRMTEDLRNVRANSHVSEQRNPFCNQHCQMKGHLRGYTSGHAGWSAVRKPCGRCGKPAYHGSAGCLSWCQGRLFALLLVALQM